MGGGNNGLGTLLLLLALGLLLIAFTRSRRQQRETLAVQQRLVPGTPVMTTSGLYATVVAVEDGVVTLETGPEQHSRWDRRAVARVLPADAPTADTTTGTTTEPGTEPGTQPEAEPPTDQQ